MRGSVILSGLDLAGVAIGLGLWYCKVCTSRTKR